MPRPEISESICRKCTADLAKRRGRPTWQRLALSFGVSSVALVVLLLATGPKRGAASLWVAAACIAAQGLVLFFGLGVRGMRVSAGARMGLALGASLLVAAVFVVLAGPWLGAGEFFGDVRSMHAAGRCAGLSAAVGALSAGVVVLAWYQTDPFTPRLSGFLAGLSGGFVGLATATIACSAQEGFHVLFGHGAAVALLGLAGLAAGRHLMAP